MHHRVGLCIGEEQSWRQLHDAVGDPAVVDDPSLVAQLVEQQRVLLEDAEPHPERYLLEQTLDRHAARARVRGLDGVAGLWPRGVVDLRGPALDDDVVVLEARALEGADVPTRLPPLVLRRRLLCGSVLAGASRAVASAGRRLGALAIAVGVPENVLHVVQARNVHLQVLLVGGLTGQLRREVADPVVRVPLRGHLIHRRHAQPVPVGVLEVLVGPCIADPVVVELPRGNRYLAYLPIYLVAVQVHAGELVVLTQSLLLAVEVLQRPVVPDAQVLDGQVVLVNIGL